MPSMHPLFDLIRKAEEQLQPVIAFVVKTDLPGKVQQMHWTYEPFGSKMQALLFISILLPFSSTDVHQGSQLYEENLLLCTYRVRIERS